jgi:hypothetical protein
MKKKVKIILRSVTNSVDAGEVFEVKKVTNTLDVVVGEHVCSNTVEKWIQRPHWTVEFVR